MALTNLLPRTINTTGASCTGSNGGSDRTYTLPDSGVVVPGLDIVINSATLHEGASNDFTIIDNVITFLNAIWDDSVIRINYFITFGSPAASTLSTSTSLKYATPLMIGEVLGIIKEIPSWDVSGKPTNEEVGIGNDSATIFYLDQKSIVSDSYILYYGATSATALALTETTHYDLDNDTGKIVLTSAGVTLVSTAKIWAKYSYYSNGMKDSFIISTLSRAEKEVDNDTNTTFTDGTQNNPSYPVKTEIQSSESIFQNRIILEEKPIIDVEDTISSDITSSGETIGVVSGSSFPSSGYIIIGSEVITYTGVSTNNLTGCSRGVLGTTAATHSEGDAVHSTIIFASDTAEGTAVSWTVQPWHTSVYADENGFIYKFKNTDPNFLSSIDVAERIKVIYYYGYSELPRDITRLTLIYAKRMMIQDNIGKALIAGRNEFNPEMFNADMNEIGRIINSYIHLPMGNT